MSHSRPNAKKTKTHYQQRSRVDTVGRSQGPASLVEVAASQCSGWLSFIHSPPDEKMHPNVDGLGLGWGEDEGAPSTTVRRHNRQPSMRATKGACRAPVAGVSLSSDLQTSMYDLASLEMLVKNRRHRHNGIATATTISSLPSPFPPRCQAGGEELSSPPRSPVAPSTVPNASFDSPASSFAVRSLSHNPLLVAEPKSMWPTPSSGYNGHDDIVSRSLALTEETGPAEAPRRHPPPLPKQQLDKPACNAVDVSGTSGRSESSTIVGRTSFLINLWLGTHSAASTSPTPILVHHNFKFLPQLCEKAATMMGCRPAPEYLFTPEGRVVRNIRELRTGAHYLILPAGCAYRESSVPITLLQGLVNNRYEAD